MGVIIPQVVTFDRATGGQVINGSVGFTSESLTRLTRTPSSAGNRRTFTWSGWVKRYYEDTHGTLLARTTDVNDRHVLALYQGQLYFFGVASGTENLNVNAEEFRDSSSWYHLVFSFDTTQANANDRTKFYVNGVELRNGAVGVGSTTVTYTVQPTQNQEFNINTAAEHTIGHESEGAGALPQELNGQLSQVYFIDGQALDASYFGFTDPLTNTWKPKKYVNTTTSPGDAAGVVGFGTNGFYLPLDGSAPIGQDQSGQGNDWTPVNFGGTVELDSPLVTGARPILNTTQGGTVAGVGVFGSNQYVGYAVTVYDDGGGNKYYIDGVKQDTVTGLIRGATYTFDTSDSTVSSHPFRFSATSNGSWGGGSEYVDGVAAITGAATTITVPHDAPNTLYYYCTSHSGMGADITGITTNEKLADQYAWRNITALPLVGVRSDVSASIACTSTTKTITASNTTHSSVQSNFYNGSIYFDDTADEYISFPGAVFSGEFCVEFWYYANALATNNGTVSVPLSGDTLDQFQVGHSSGNGIEFFFDGSLRAQSGPIGLNKWYHIALTRDSSNVLKLYVDGVQKGNTPTVSTSETVTTFYLGVQYRSSDADYHRTNGYIQDFRIYNGTVKYSSNFVVPSTSPAVLPDTPSGVVGGSKLTKITDGAVNFDGSGDYLTCNSSDFAFGTGDFTVEAYVYLDSLINYRCLATTRPDNSGYSDAWHVGFDANGLIALYSNAYDLSAPNGSIAPKKWSHVVVTRDSSTARIFVDGKLVVSGSVTKNYTKTLLGIGDFPTTQAEPMKGPISNLRIIKGSIPTEYQTSSTTAGTQVFTPPTRALTNVTNTKLLCCQSNTSATASVVEPSSDGTGYTGNTSAITVTSANLDAGSDTNIVDGDTSTVAQIRGAGSFVQLVFPQQQNGTLQVNVANGNDVGDDDIRVFIDGVEGTSFDVSSQQWYTIHTGDFTTVKLEHQGSTTGYIYGFRIGTSGDTIINASGGITANGDAAATTFNPFNTDINTVRGQETGYCTWNPLEPTVGTLSKGNLKMVGSSAWRSTKGTISVSSGKWYYEGIVNGTIYGQAFSNIAFGIGWLTTKNTSSNVDAGTSSLYNNLVAFHNNGGYNNFATWQTSVATLVQGDVIGSSLDKDNNTFEFFVNGVSVISGTLANTTDDLSPWTNAYYSDSFFDCNFGQKPFKFPPPDGFQPLNIANTRPVKVISRPDQFVGVTTYSGDNTDPKQINLGMAPDLIWVKARNQTNWNWLTDTVRGAPNKLYSNDQQAEDTAPIYGQADSLNDFGFVAGGGTDSGDPLSDSNKTGTDYAVWSWKAGGNKNTFNVDDVGYASAAAAGLTAGSVTPTGASVGTKQGFSIIKWDAPDPQDNSATIPHGLTQKPDFWIVKSTTRAADWIVYSEQIDGTLDFGHINNTEAFANSSATAPTATTFGVYGDDINYAGATQIAYLWHDVPGLQKFGRYTGNESTDGPYVELGFEPAVLIIKNASGDHAAGANWFIFDGTRDPDNPVRLNLNPNDNSIEEDDSSGTLDFFSNGFKIRSNGTHPNGSGNTIIYAAWAKAPSVDLFGGGANAH